MLKWTPKSQSTIFNLISFESIVFHFLFVWKIKKQIQGVKIWQNALDNLKCQKHSRTSFTFQDLLKDK